MATAYDAGLIDRIMPRVKQWESTTGRRISPAMLDSLIKGQLEAEVGKAQQSRALDLQERSIANEEQAARDAKSAAKAKGFTDIASTAGMGYLTYKSVTKPSAMSELIEYQKSISGTPVSDVAFAPTTSSFSAPTAEAAGFGLKSPAYTAPTIGAQTTLAGGTTAAGGQAALVGGETGSLAAYDASLAAGAAEGVGSTAGAGASGLGATSLLGAAGVGAIGGTLLGPTLDKILPGGGKAGRAVGAAAGGALSGAAAGMATGAWAGPVGAVVGGIVGGAISLISDSVICGELLRQGHITERERTACIVFRFRRIPDPMFHAYLEWAAPIVAAMKQGGWRNALLLPFAILFVKYMIATQAGIKPTLAERLVWKYAWLRCSRIARKQGAMMIAEVA